ncbi:restriction endonuclease [Marispirochaeta sp.]|uniref:restriction endonuclease n=1 Tax=Marispirochaeta sp. TaxID=2038653 RepID=UPI0029C9A547|nr:restriction endonuclease [Marispirochaeta sp.]
MIPDFQTIMLPLLKTFQDGEEKTSKELREKMVSYFNISIDEQKEKIPSGKQPLYYNRVAWAIAYLKMADLISSPLRAVYKITEEGKKVLENPPEKITINFLKQFDSFSKNRNPEKDTELDDNNQIVEKTPDELIEIGYKQVKNELSLQILNQIKDCSPYFFEKLVLDLLIKMGYGGSEMANGEVTPKGSDEGIDGIIKEDKLGLDKIYIQAKKWENCVGRPEIQKFVGALQGKRAKKGIFITMSTFSKEALEYAENLDVAVILIDGKKLANYMIENELGVSLKQNYKIYNVDTDYFIEE